jgi:hypothetical protein
MRFSTRQGLEFTIYRTLLPPNRMLLDDFHLVASSILLFHTNLACTHDREFEPLSGRTKDYKIGICCFSAKHAALRRKSKDWLARILLFHTNLACTHGEGKILINVSQNSRTIHFVHISVMFAQRVHNMYLFYS